MIFDVITVNGAPTAEAAASSWARSQAEHDQRYRTSEEWRVVGHPDSYQRQLRSGDVQVGVAVGEDGTWHLLGAALCRP